MDAEVQAPGRRPRWAKLRRAAVGVMGGVLLLACYDWYVWDKVFDTTAPGGSHYPSSETSTPSAVPGWYGGDGASSVPLPNFANRRDRTVWLHGDSFLNDSSGNIVVTPSNSIMVSDLPSSAAKGTPPADSDRKWYARTSSLAVKDVTTNAGGTSPAALPFFYNTNNPTTEDRLWPGDGVVIGTKLFAFFHEWFHPLQADQQAIDTHVFSVSSVDLAVTSWGTPVMNTLERSNGDSPLAVSTLQLQWGNAVYYDSGTGYAYIFGMSSAVSPFPFYVARAKDVNCSPSTNPCITNYEQWEFFKSNSTWSQGAPSTLSALKQLGNIASATEFSVDKITINSTTRYVLVHTRSMAQNDLVVQVSKSNSLTDWQAFDPNTASQYYWYGNIADDTNGLDPSVELGSYPACFNAWFGTPVGQVWAGKAAYYLSPDTKLYSTYYASVLDYSKEPNDHRNFASCLLYGGIVGTLRVSNAIDLLKLRPWCTSSCWN